MYISYYVYMYLHKMNMMYNHHPSELLGTYGGFHGGSPMAGWFISWKILSKWMMTRGTLYFMETSI